jgi:hypothetical protein
MENYKKIHETAIELASYLSRYDSTESLKDDYLIEGKINSYTLFDDAEISIKEFDEKTLNSIIKLSFDKSGFYELL